ncbi:Alpha-crystallin A chain [Orchesella cincta]|uniref:Alpha-crystallin A chain n=1 Tax=Orchesella cincta TaxID=48709 RepID=A0A1D2NC29_ORCCI|nr:Alpha-crystallin A chain [Orchesella cincta]
MIIPIELESTSAQTESKALQPLVTFPSRSALSRRKEFGGFGEVLFPALAKYLQLRNSPLKDFKYLLAKENPLKIESFKCEGDKYELKLNVQTFKPEEIQVKITDRWITIIGEHEDRTDERNFSRQEFLRKYTIPNEVNSDDITCELSSDGYLLISAPKMEEKVKISEIPIPISITHHVSAIKSI